MRLAINIEPPNLYAEIPMSCNSEGIVTVDHNTSKIVGVFRDAYVDGKVFHCEIEFIDDFAFLEKALAFLEFGESAIVKPADYHIVAISLIKPSKRSI